MEQRGSVQFGPGLGQEEHTAIQILESPEGAKTKARAQNTPNKVELGTLPSNSPNKRAPGEAEISLLELKDNQGTDMLSYPAHRDTQVMNVQSPEYKFPQKIDEEPPSFPGQIVVNPDNHIHDDD